LDAVNGDDANPGTSEAPWKTITKALGITTSGDTVIMTTGTYDAFIDQTPNRSDWLTFQAADGAKPELPYIRIGSTGWGKRAYLKLKGLRVISNETATGGNRILYVKDAPYVEIKDCYLYGYKRYLSIGVLIESDEFILDHCEVYYNLDSSEYFPTILDAGYLPGKTRGIELYGSNIQIINNYIHDFASSGIMVAAPSTNVLIENNHVANQHATWPGPDPKSITNSVHGSGIALISGDITIKRNVIRAVGRTKPLNVYGIIGNFTGLANNLVIENNLFFDNPQSVTVGTSSEGRFGSGCKFNHNTVINSYDKLPPQENFARYLHAFNVAWDANYSGDFEFYNNLTVGDVINVVGGPAWQSGALYSVDDRVKSSYIAYDCIQAHASNDDNKPGAGPNWTKYWVLAPGRVWNAGHNIVFAYLYPYQSQSNYHWNTLADSTILCSADSGYGWHWKGAGWDPEADFFIAEGPDEMLLVISGSDPAGYHREWADFRLKAGSPAINYGNVTKAIAAGKSLGTIGPDGFIRDDGVIRDETHHSAGCYEYGSEPLKGDLNRDGKVNIQDVQCCVNHILGKQDWGSKADVNGDGKVDEGDVQEIINIILRE